jgi:lipopolysaccharide heptosyltransferase I
LAFRIFHFAFRICMRLLIVRLGALGDIVHAVPALAALRRTWRDARIDWLVSARHRAVLEFVEGLDEQIVLDGGLGWRRLPATVRALRSRRYDAVLDLQGLIKSAVLARASGARRVIGFGRGALREPLAGAFYSERHVSGDRQHVIRKNLALAAAAGAAGTDRIEFPLRVPPGPDVGADPYVLLNPGAGWPNKQWPGDRFARLARWIADRYGWRSIVLWGPREEQLAASIVAASDGAAERAPRTSIGDVLGLARRARLLVSGDTGPLHLAAAVGTPIVGLFGPTSPARNGPFDPADLSLSEFEVCVCHHERRCRRDRPCIEAITIDAVTAAVDRRIAALTQR